MAVTDSELVVKAKAGDKQAFTELFDRYRDRILRFLYGYVGNYETAEDLTIETFSDVYRSLPRYQDIGTFSSWLYKIARDYAKKEFRRRQRHPEVSLDEPIPGGEEGSTMSAEVADESLRPDHEARKSELSDFIYKTLAKLDKKYSDALLLCDIEGMDYESAAKVLQCNSITLGTRLRRGREMLYEILKKNGYQI